MRKNRLIIVRGGGDIATGTIHKLYRSGFSVLVLETEHPSAIRRHVAFSEAVYDGEAQIDGVVCERAKDLAHAKAIMAQKKVALLVDPAGSVIPKARPLAVVDAILAKKNLGTHRAMAPLTVALGPGFTAGVDVDVVIETMRGHTLGKLIYEGTAIPNTGIPGAIAGVSKERVIHAQHDGVLFGVKRIGDFVKKGEPIAYIRQEKAPQGGERGMAYEPGYPVNATIDGLLRGLIRDGYPVTAGFKIADIDPRESEYENCFTISDKARCIAGGVLETVMHFLSDD